MIHPIDDKIKELSDSQLIKLESYLNADIMSLFGPMDDYSVQFIRENMERLVQDIRKKNILYIILTTYGGSATAVERYVNIIRQHYEEVNFIVPDYAYSAGTIFCMSGDKILMDYYSVLGPIDPQTKNKDGNLVSALGYLDKVNELIAKSKNNQLSLAEFLILKELDLADLRAYEQAKELTIDQLKKWLVKYKFKNWNTNDKGGVITEQEKLSLAEEIASKLSDNNLWKSHGRPINIEILEKDLKLEIENFGKDKKLSGLIKSYYNFIVDYIYKSGHSSFIHTRRCFYGYRW